MAVLTGTKIKALLEGKTLLQKFGFDGFSFQDIADVLRLRKQSLYVHFKSKEDLAKTTLQRFESLATMLLSAVPLAGRSEVAQQIRRQYAAVFKQRLDVALKDIEIGFIDGRRVDTHPVPSTTTKLSDAVILKPTIMGMGFDLHKAGLWLKDRPTIMRAGVKLHKAWQWLKGRF